MKNLEALKSSKQVEILSVFESKLLKGGGVVEGADNLTGELD